MRSTQSRYSALNIQMISPHGSCNAAWLQWCLLHPSRNYCLCHNLSPPSPRYSCQHKMESGMRTKVNVSYCCLNLSVSAGTHSLVPQETVSRASSQPQAPLCNSSQEATCPCETWGSTSKLTSHVHEALTCHGCRLNAAGHYRRSWLDRNSKHDRRSWAPVNLFGGEELFISGKISTWDEKIKINHE